MTRLTAAIKGDLRKMMAAELTAAHRAVVAGTQQATEGLKSEFRRDVVSSGLGARLANTWRSKFYDDRPLKVAGFVFSKAPVIISAHAEGGEILPKHGRFLAIPLPAAGVSRRGKRPTPATGRP